MKRFIYPPMALAVTYSMAIYYTLKAEYEPVSNTTLTIAWIVSCFLVILSFYLFFKPSKNEQL